MAWLEITVKTSPEGIEEVAAALTAGGFSELLVEDQSTYEAFLEDNRAYWDYIDETLQQTIQGLSQIKLYLPQEEEAAFGKLTSLVEGLKASDKEGKLGSLEVTSEVLPDTDWEEGWKDNYPPQPIGKKLMVLPIWNTEEDTQGRLPVILDPGLTFGTGEHPSTQMVMEAMEELLTPGGSCLDLGSGSGILSIAALRLGAKTAVGVDIDPKAEDIARENCGYNGFASPEFTAYTGNVLTDKPLMDRLCSRRYDIVLVNIVADVIISLAPVLPGLLDESSHLICSGILDTRYEEVVAALQGAGLTVTGTRSKEDWRCVTARKR